LDPGQRDELKRLDREFRDVDVVRLDAMIFRRATVHMNNAYYGFLLKVCELAFEATLPDADGSGFRFTEVLRDERKMALVFQAFVRNFYRIEQSRFSVVPLQLRWDATAQNASDHDLLPVMTTDIFLRSPDRKIIIDTKYYASALTEHHGKKSFHSDHLFQLFAYLKNARTRGAEYLTPEGVLLYPAVGERLNSRFAIQGHPVTVATVNLDQPWKDIRIGLLDLLENGPVARVREQETEP
jgi:5-methylcytosine-specific restriction enzyme subunit McrC